MLLKRNLIIFLVITMLLMCSCGTSAKSIERQEVETASKDETTITNDTPDANNEPPTVQESENPPAPIVDYPLQKQTYSWSSETGYSADIEIQIGDWIKATDNDLLLGAWASVQGTGEPSISTLPTETTAYAIGTVMVKNATSGFTLNSENNIDFGIRHHGQNIKVQYNEENQKIGGVSVAAADPGYIFPSTIPSNGTWGPIPFAIFYLSAFSPADPDGTPEFLDKKIIFYAVSSIFDSTEIPTFEFSLDNTWQ